MHVLNPPDGAVYLIDPTLRREFQTLRLRASIEAGGRIEWRVDGSLVGTSQPGGTLDWPLAAGAHVVSARDGRGGRGEAAFVVK